MTSTSRGSSPGGSAKLDRYLLREILLPLAISVALVVLAVFLFQARRLATAALGLGLGLEDAVRFVSKVSDERMVELYAEAQVAVVPSLYEGFGLPPLEAMAMGTPVVATSASCLPEVLGDAALFVAPEDEEGLAEALRAVREDAVLRVRDDGLGIDADGLRSGTGVRGMRERALLVGGRLNVFSAPGEGTTIELTMGAT